MAASGGWIEGLFELVFRAALGWLKHWHEWWPFGCLAASIGAAAMLGWLLVHLRSK